MSREIKFRCWNSFSNVMHGWDEMVDKNKIHLLCNENKSYICEQFTGFLDDKEREVYHGDLVALSVDIGHIPVPELFEIRWSDDGKWIIYRDRCEFYDICDYDFRVITNIHKNPELRND